MVFLGENGDLAQQASSCEDHWFKCLSRMQELRVGGLGFENALFRPFQSNSMCTPETVNIILDPSGFLASTQKFQFQTLSHKIVPGSVKAVGSL